MKMPELQCYCLFFLLALFAGMCSGTRTIPKYGCRGDSMKLFQNISFNHTTMSLSKNGDMNEIIAKWHMQNNLLNSSILNGYNDKLYLDKYGNMWFLNLRETDDAKYTMQIGVGKNATKHEVQLIVMVAPTMQCKPNIVHVDNTLSAHVDPAQCGKPVASVYWLDHSGILVAPQVIKLQPRKDNGIYHACIRGDALKCANISQFSDYCTVFKDNTSFNPDASPNSSDMASDTSGMTMGTFVIAVLFLTLLSIAATWKIINLARKSCKQKSGAAKRKTSKEEKSGAAKRKTSKDDSIDLKDKSGAATEKNSNEDNVDPEDVTQHLLETSVVANSAQSKIPMSSERKGTIPLNPVEIGNTNERQQHNMREKNSTTKDVRQSPKKQKLNKIQQATSDQM